jgi:putative transposase
VFFEWYNQEHHHSGIGLLTPATVHCGQAVALCAKMSETPNCWSLMT